MKQKKTKKKNHPHSHWKSAKREILQREHYKSNWINLSCRGFIILKSRATIYTASRTKSEGQIHFELSFWYKSPFVIWVHTHMCRENINRLKVDRQAFHIFKPSTSAKMREKSRRRHYIRISWLPVVTSGTQLVKKTRMRHSHSPQVCRCACGIYIPYTYIYAVMRGGRRYIYIYIKEKCEERSQAKRV